ncbi:OmpW/AlkL family protein [Flavobacterium rhizosphaerae]|uniref:OmpW family outer membrane protein n=1 Tax=Flavobacterium rhizosphaerae TaxID=3163298 RepID=A0ABW8YXP7_9FLAO
MKKILFAAIALSLFGLNQAQAQDDENTTDFKKWQVRLRGVGVIPDESADISTIGGNVAISNSFIPELDFTYYFTKHIAAELILGTTKHDVHTTASDISAIGGPSSTNVDLGSVWLLPPTLTVQYHFYPGKVFRPYVGAGVNYTIFYSVDEGSTVKDVSYDNAFGYAFQGGFDLMLNDTFFINVDCKKIFLKTDVSVDASNLAPGLSIPAKVDINPLLLGFGVGMKF